MTTELEFYRATQPRQWLHMNPSFCAGFNLLASGSSRTQSPITCQKQRPSGLRENAGGARVQQNAPQFAKDLNTWQRPHCASTTGATGTAVPHYHRQCASIPLREALNAHAAESVRVSFKSAATFRRLSKTSLLQNFGRGVVHGPSVLYRVLN